NVRVRSFIKAHVAVADLCEAQLARRLRRSNFRKRAHAVGIQNTTFNYAKGASAGPGHTLQEAAAVHAVGVLVMQNLVFFYFLGHCHLSIPLSCALSFPARIWGCGAGERA